jgi:transposase
MDNARIHHSKIFTEYMKTVNNKILYNVPYCSELNPIEMVFSKVKSIVHKKDNNENSQKLQKNIKNGFNKITQENLKGYYENSLPF